MFPNKSRSPQGAKACFRQNIPQLNQSVPIRAVAINHHRHHVCPLPLPGLQVRHQQIRQPTGIHRHANHYQVSRFPHERSKPPCRQRKIPKLNACPKDIQRSGKVHDHLPCRTRRTETGGMYFHCCFHLYIPYHPYRQN